MKNKILQKVAMFGDLHVGAKSGSIQHNEDCLEYITWFINNIKNDPNIDHIIDLGDFFDDRSKLSTSTLDYGYKISKMIDDLGLPFFRLIGNHSIALRNSRKIHNMIEFSDMPNSIIINEITPINYLGKNGAVLCPFLFEDEYPQLLNYTQYPIAFMHPEFKGFVITGDTIEKEHGPDHSNYKSFRRIYGGHFHRRQIKDNVVYIGNAFPTNFADANDTERGFATYEYANDNLEFFNWPNMPTYIKTKLSTMMGNPKKILREKATVNCLVDMDLTYEEALELKSSIIKKYKLRELTLDESIDIKAAIDGDTEIDEDVIDTTMNTIIVDKLKTVAVKNIDNNKLVELYNGIKL